VPVSVVSLIAFVGYAEAQHTVSVALSGTAPSRAPGPLNSHKGNRPADKVEHDHGE